MTPLFLHRHDCFQGKHREREKFGCLARARHRIHLFSLRCMLVIPGNYIERGLKQPRLCQKACKSKQNTVRFSWHFIDVKVFEKHSCELLWKNYCWDQHCWKIINMQGQTWSQLKLKALRIYQGIDVFFYILYVRTRLVKNLKSITWSDISFLNKTST